MNTLLLTLVLSAMPIRPTVQNVTIIDNNQHIGIRMDFTQPLNKNPKIIAERKGRRVIAWIRGIQLQQPQTPIWGKGNNIRKVRVRQITKSTARMDIILDPSASKDLELSSKALMGKLHLSLNGAPLPVPGNETAINTPIQPIAPIAQQQPIQKTQLTPPLATAASPNANNGFGGSDIAVIIVALLALGGAFAWSYMKKNKSRFVPSFDSHVELMATTNLDNKHKLQLVSVNGSKILLAVCNDSISVINKWTDTDTQNDEPEQNFFNKNFGSFDFPYEQEQDDVRRRLQTLQSA